MKVSLYWCFAIIIASCSGKPQHAEEDFPEALTHFEAVNSNPVFTAGGDTAWDKKIRERGFILFEDSIYKMWYTGFRSDDAGDSKKLGYATSKDGIHWQRFANNPLFSERWTEDMCVVKEEGKYFMFAEGTGDVAHLLISEDGIKWKDHGDLIILKTNGDTIPGPYGTPTVFVENGKWYLYYERNDEAIWLATSNDKRTWTNVQDEPVLKPGPEKFDLGAVAADQVIKYNGRYYLFYHANADPMWTSKPTPWSSDIAVSKDLIHWKKFAGNPITDGDHSSPIVVPLKDRFLLYTMHPDVWLYEGKKIN